jgi:polar amino acid transport system substrate-binding protein
VIAAATVALAGCGTLSTSPAAGTFTPTTKDVLTVVTTDVPSAGFWTGTAEHPTGGFEYELARDLATRFGLKSVRVELEHFHRVVAGQLDGADLALDLITPTDKRREHLDFSSPYLNGAPTVVVRSLIDVPDLATAQALQWGAVRATTLVDVINNLIAPDQPVRLYDNNTELVSGLESGQVEAILLDQPQAVVTANESHGRLAAVAQLPSTEVIAAALPKGSDNVQAVDSAMRAFTADGTIEKLLREWIGDKAADAERSIPLLRTTR